jgi:hypothetical protein
MVDDWFTGRMSPKSCPFSVSMISQSATVAE